MGRKELDELRMVIAVLAIVEQIGLVAKVVGDFRIAGEECVESGVVNAAALCLQPRPDVWMGLQETA